MVLWKRLRGSKTWYLDGKTTWNLSLYHAGKELEKGKRWRLRETVDTMSVRSKADGKVGMGPNIFKWKFCDWCSNLTSFQRQQNSICGKNNVNGSWQDEPVSKAIVISTWGPTFNPSTWRKKKKTAKKWTIVYPSNSSWGGRDSRIFGAWWMTSQAKSMTS